MLENRIAEKQKEADKEMARARAEYRKGCRSYSG
jgi:hypothetical protein